MNVAQEIQKVLYEKYNTNVAKTDIDRFLVDNAEILGLFYTETKNPWNVYVPIAHVAYTLLSAFLDQKDKMMSCDPDFATLEEWHEAIEKMRNAFALVIEDDSGDRILTVEEYEQMQEGFCLFGYYFRSLWD